MRKKTSKIGQNKSQPQHPNRKPLPKQKQQPIPPPPQPPPTLPPKSPNHPNSNMTIAYSNTTNANNVNKTDTNNSVECDRCGMIFLNENFLVMHKEKFCIGPQQLSDPNNNNNNNNYYRSVSPPFHSKYIQQNNKLQFRFQINWKPTSNSNEFNSDFK